VTSNTRKKADEESPRSSEGLIVELAREVQQAQIGAMESLDTKAANLIAFAGIVVALIFSSNFVEAHWTAVLAVGTGLLAFSVLPLVYVLGRSFSFDPNIAALDDLFSGTELDDSLHWLRDSLRGAVDRNADSLRRRTRAVRCSALIIVVALALVVGSLISSQETNAHARIPKTPSRFVDK
jgi:hypothetical protein